MPISHHDQIITHQIEIRWHEFGSVEQLTRFAMVESRLFDGTKPLAEIEWEKHLGYAIDSVIRNLPEKRNISYHLLRDVALFNGGPHGADERTTPALSMRGGYCVDPNERDAIWADMIALASVTRVNNAGDLVSWWWEFQHIAPFSHDSMHAVSAAILAGVHYVLHGTYAAVSVRNSWEA